MSAQFFSSLADNALFVAAVELLRTAGIENEALDRLAEVRVMGHGRQVGSVVVTDAVGAGAQGEGA